MDSIELSIFATICMCSFLHAGLLPRWEACTFGSGKDAPASHEVELCPRLRLRFHRARKMAYGWQNIS